MSMILDGSNGVTFNDASLQGAAASPYVLKNRLINGDMRIDQRNAGASINNDTTGSQFSLDRWLIYGSQASKFSIQQNAGSVTPPAGFTNYLGCTSLSSYSVGSTDEFDVIQRLEGFNTSDLAWGTANAKTVTLSFWVRSSLTGTFGGMIGNDTLNRRYIYSYSISSANTWEYKTITIAGDTSGTWLTTNGKGMQIYFCIGAGTSNQGTAGSWGATTLLAPTGQTSVVGTNGATFYITGVQLEQNTSATSFERRLYNQELAACQRYYYRQTAGAVGVRFGCGQAYATTNAVIASQFPVTMRTAPTALEQNGTAAHYAVLNSAASGVTCSAVPVFNSGSVFMSESLFTVASGLVAGNATFGLALNATGYLGWSAEL